MIINDKIDMSVLKQMFKKDRFCLPYSVSDIQQALLIAYEVEVRGRGGKMVGWLGEKTVSDLMLPIAEWLTSPLEKNGLLLYGGVGTGKTTALYALRRVINASCKATPNDNTLRGFGSDMIEVVKAKHIVECYTSDQTRYLAMKRTDLLAIDELGVENVDVKNYGNSSEPIIDLLSYRYDKQKMTAVTSNLTMKQIEERYGLRLADRFNEMFHKVAFVGESYRKTTRQ